jgi:hypothetical protein
LSLTNAWQVVALPNAAEAGEHETTVRVGRFAGELMVTLPLPLLALCALSPP